MLTLRATIERRRVDFVAGLDKPSPAFHVWRQLPQGYESSIATPTW